MIEKFHASSSQGDLKTLVVHAWIRGGNGFQFLKYSLYYKVVLRENSIPIDFIGFLSS